jgi:hypothetical protein
MQFAKPPGGFCVDEPPAIAALIAAHYAKWPRLAQHWIDVKDRLRQTGHREGVPVKGPAGARLFVADGDATLPRLRVAYLVLGETLYLKMVTVA